MNVRVLAVAVAATLLYGCSDASWDRTMSWAGLKSADEPAPTTPAQVTAAPLPPTAADKTASFCHDVAKSAQETAAANGFDEETQQRRGQVSYQQCMGQPAGQ